MRLCPFAECGVEIAHHRFCCGKHWRLLDKQQQQRIHAAYAEYLEETIGVGELRERQHAILDEVERRVLAQTFELGEAGA